MFENWQVKIVDKGYTLLKDIFIFFVDRQGRVHLMQGEDKIIILDEGVAAPEPTLKLTNEALQAFATALNEQGINPKKEFLDGKLEATEKHLEDMRSLVFKSKEINSNS